MNIDSFDFEKFYDDPWVLAQAKETAVSVMRYERRRTREEVEDDCLLGYACEQALFVYLQSRGVDVRKAPADDKTYDLEVVKGSETYKIDVKALRRGKGGKYFEIPAWEFENASADTMYLVFDCSFGDAIFEGWVFHDQFKQSNYPDPRGRCKGWIRWQELENEEDLPF
jgi:hypothetical protein